MSTKKPSLITNVYHGRIVESTYWHDLPADDPARESHVVIFKGGERVTYGTLAMACLAAKAEKVEADALAEAEAEAAKEADAGDGGADSPPAEPTAADESPDTPAS